ncbi:MAG: hypothetical protein JNL66_21975 [Alphaproteobacteria bacterium]|nr:hypothetical protein [Alphaproteobacteria bacterium]
MTKAAMTSISGASLRRLVRPLLGVATVAALGIAVAPAATAAPAVDRGADHGIVAKGPDGKADDKGKASVGTVRPAASVVSDSEEKKKDDGGSK